MSKRPRQRLDQPKPRGRTVPRTKIVKARSSENALTHGVTSNLPVIADETGEQWLAHVEGVIQSFQPQSSVEQTICMDIAWTQWRLFRVARYEQAGTALNERASEKSYLKYFKAKGGNPVIEFEDYAKLGCLPLLGRIGENIAIHETRLTRRLDRLFDQLEKVRRLHRKPKNSET